MTGPLPAERWRRIASLLDEILELPEERRAAHLDEACASDPELKRQVLAYLAAGEGAGSFLEGSPVTGLDAASSFPGSPPPPEEQELDAVGPYRLLRRIGTGGMGVVYLATRADGQFEKEVALKLVRRGLDTEEILARFRRERQILARLEHPHIARLLDGSVSDDGRPYLVMEYVEGEPVTTWCAAHAAGIDERLRLFHDIGETVQYAHRNLVVHRDLKPSNILVSADGQVKLLDFGIAKLLAEEGGERAATLTRSGYSPMTPEYAAPEQALDAPLTTAADVYSLGVVLYELLTGQRPPRGRTPEAGALPGSLPAPTTDTGPPPPSRIVATERQRRRLRGDLDTITLKALQHDPARRYRTVEALLDDLDRHRDGLPIRARRDTWSYRTGKFLTRHRWGAAAAALVALSLGVGIAGTAWQARRARQEADKAREVKEFTLSLFKVSDPHHAKDHELSARELLDEGARRVEVELRNQPEVQAEMMQLLGRVYGNLGIYDRGRPLLERALALQRATAGGDDAEVASTLHDLGALLNEKGDYDEAEKTLRASLALEEREVGKEDPRLAPILSDLGTLLTATGQYEESERIYRRALSINQRAFGADDLEVSMNLSDLGTLLYSHGRYHEAVDLFQQALTIRDAHPGSEGFDTDIVRHNYAGTLAMAGDLDRADPLMRRVLLDRRNALGPDHPEVAVSLDVLGNLLSDKGEYDEAGTTLRQALDIRRRVLGEDSADVAKTLNNLAFLEYRRGDFPAARRLFEQSLTTWRKNFPEAHPYVLAARHGGAMVMAETGETARAEPVLREILAARVARFGDENLQVAQSRYVLGGLLARWGRLDEAEPMLRQALATREKSLGADHFIVAAAQETLAGVLRDQGRLEESLALYQQALSSDRKTFSRAGPQTASVLVGLGRTLLALRRPAEAEPLLREGLAIRKQALVPGDPRTAEAMAALGCSLYEEGNAVEARRLLEDGLPVLERRWTPPGPLVGLGRTTLARMAAPGR
ncbi:MAG TPA: serine/threonine-protein kinase [Dongiaceae bacterium]|nr:serine/threonine-protein kinase [Dongiaceae bacterium]